MTKGDSLPFSIMGKKIDFVVDSTSPSGAVVVTLETSFRLGTMHKPLNTGVPRITYEDLGGLTKEIQKIREMIELPLRHPEIFERVGIEAPKGVLLYGPPGTGKTLLAKAVANETNSNFYSIAGPEIMGKFYGESLLPEEPVLVRHGGVTGLRKIADVVESGDTDQLEAACLKDGRIEFRPVTGLFRHERRGRLFEVSTASGRRIRVTDKHSLFTYGDGGMRSIPTTELEADKSYIVVPRFLPAPSNITSSIDLFALFEGDDHSLRVRASDVWELVAQAVRILGRANAERILGYRPYYLSTVKRRNLGIRLRLFRELLTRAQIEFNEVERRRVRIWALRSSLPGVLEIDEKLAFFFGLWLAEGDYNSGTIRLTVNSGEVKLFKGLIPDYLGKPSVAPKKGEDCASIILTNTVGLRMMKDLGFRSGASVKHVPEIVWNIADRLLGLVLRGYFTGDGSVRKSPTPVVEAGTSSEELANCISYLLLRFGVLSRTYITDGPFFRLVIGDVDGLRGFLKIGFADEARNEIFRAYVNDPARGSGRIERVPVELLQAAGVDFPSIYAGLKSIGKNAVLKRMSVLPSQLKPLFEGDIMLDSVNEIREISDETKYVYDIEVDDTHNFVSGYGGLVAHNSEERLRGIFKEAQENAPSIIFIDEIDSIAPKREEVSGELEKRIVSQLLTLMDGLESRGKVVVIAATNRPDALDPALRRPGRFDREIEIGIPDEKSRLEILQIHTRGMPMEPDVKLEEMARVTHGFVGADLQALAREAAILAVRRVIPEISMDETKVPAKTLNRIKVKMQDFQDALRDVQPSAMREVLVQAPNVKWEDIGGLTAVKEELTEAVEWPLKYGKLFAKGDVKPPKGILLYGPPGTGKTLIAKAVANESEANFISIKGPELISKWVGESEKGVREVFRKARAAAPCVIFFDEVDAIAPRRKSGENDSQVTERVVSQLLTEMDGLEELKGVVVLGATNRPDIIDEALLRPGRFDKLLRIPPPDKEGRIEILKIHTKKKPLAKDVDITKLAEMTEGYTGAELAAAANAASMTAIKQYVKAHGKEAETGTGDLTITMRDFEEAIKETKRKATPDSGRQRPGLG